PGTTGDVITNTNWTPNGVPTTGDTVQFGTTGTTSVFNNQDFATRNITFLAGANAYTWTANGTSAITVGSGSASSTRGNITNSSSIAQVVNMGTGLLTITGNVTGTADIALNGSIFPGANTNNAGAYLDFTGTN